MITMTRSIIKSVNAMSGANSGIANTDPATMICPLLLKTPWYKQFRKDNKMVKDFILAHVYSHQDSLQANNIRDVTDAFLADDLSKKFSLDGFCRILREFFAAGTDTVSTALSWTVLYLAVHPDKQQKVRLGTYCQVLKPMLEEGFAEIKWAASYLCGPSFDLSMVSDNL